MRRDQLAINTVSIKFDKLEEGLDACAKAGFRNVEFVIAHLETFLNDGHSIEDLKAVLAARQLQCIGGFKGGIQAWGDAHTRKANHEQIVANAELLGSLGATGMVVGTDGPEDGGEAEAVIDALAAALASVGEQIAATGVTLCLEFNWSPVVKSVRTAAEIARRSGRENVGVLFDPAHYHCTPSKFEHLTAENVKTIKHVHVDDMNDKPGELCNCNADRALPGEGCLDLGALFGRIEEHGYKGFFSIEMFSDELWGMAADQAAKKMYESLLPLCRD